MLKITENTKVYAYCPAGVETGGVELLHQVIDIINNNGGNGYVYYVGDKPHRVPNAYKKYNIEVCEEIEDNEQNIIILPETKPFIVFEYSNIRVLVWWMSVDFFYKLNRGNLIIGDIFKFNKREAIKELLKRFISLKSWSKKRYSLKNLRENKRIIYNCYQSMYASDFLARNGFSNRVRLSDYINDDYKFDDSLINNKKDVVIYNPKKGYEFTKKLVKRAPDIRWIPIQNMTREQVKALMIDSKIYIDFGFHPGKDRMPREAAMCGCCIITGKQGAAGYKDDLFIDENKYKFTQKNRDIKRIINTIHSVMKNYEIEIQNFSEYRYLIKQEKNEFQKEVFDLFFGGKD